MTAPVRIPIDVPTDDPFAEHPWARSAPSNPVDDFLTGLKSPGNPVDEFLAVHLNAHNEDDVAPPPKAQATAPAVFTPAPVRFAEAERETTRLSPEDEDRFQSWAAQHNLTDVDQPASHYDYRGAFTAGISPSANGHWPDTYKQHGHPTFSVESQYSSGPDDGGHWDGETFIPARPPRSSADIRASLGDEPAPEPFTLGGSPLAPPTKSILAPKGPGPTHPNDIVKDLVHPLPDGTDVSTARTQTMPEQQMASFRIPRVRPDATEPAAPTGTNADVLTRDVSAGLAPTNEASLAEATRPTTTAGKVAYAAGSMAAHPLSTVASVVEALPKAAWTLGQFTAQEQRKGAGLWKSNDGEDAADVVSPRDAAFAAGQLLASGASEAALPFVDSYLGASMAAKVEKALAAEPEATAARRAQVASSAMLSDFSKRVATQAAAGGAIGASFSSDDPKTGAILGALVGGLHAYAQGAHGRIPIDGANLQDHPDQLLSAGRHDIEMPVPREATATPLSSPPHPTEPDFTVESPAGNTQAPIPLAPPEYLRDWDERTMGPKPTREEWALRQRRTVDSFLDVKQRDDALAALAKQKAGQSTPAADVPAQSPEMAAIANATRLVGPREFLTRVRQHVSSLGDNLSPAAHDAAIAQVASAILAGQPPVPGQRADQNPPPVPPVPMATPAEIPPPAPVMPPAVNAAPPIPVPSPVPPASLRTPAGTLRANLSRVPDADLVNEYGRMLDANTADEDKARPTYVRDESNHFNSEGNAWVGLTGGAVYAKGRIASRNRTTAKIEAELTRRGWDQGRIMGALYDYQANQPKTPYDTPEVIAARRLSMDTPETITDESPEREQLRSDLAEQHYATAIESIPEVRRTKEVGLVIGHSGSGKTTLAVEPLSRHLGGPVFDTDAAKRLLPEYDNGQGSKVVFREAGKINKAARDLAASEGQNFIFPTVGSDPARLKDMLDALHEDGYRVHVRYVHVPVDIAAQRAADRYTGSVRALGLPPSHFVDPVDILRVGRTPLESYRMAKAHPATISYAHVDNSEEGQPPRLVEAHNAPDVERYADRTASPISGRELHPPEGIPGSSGSGGFGRHDEEHPGPTGQEPEPEPVAGVTRDLFGDRPPADESIGIRNATTDADRERLGLGERQAPEPRTQDEMYAAGKAEAERNPTAIPSLIDALRADPERIVGTKAEAGLLLKHRVDLEHGLKELIARHEAAQADGDTAGERVARLQLAAHREQIREFVGLAERTGTATGRALAARKMMSALDYSLSHMEAMSEAAKGSPLTEAELAKVRKMHDDLTARLKAMEADVGAAHERAAAAEAELHHAKLRLEVAGPLADRITARLDKAAKSARVRLRARGLRASVGLDPAELADYAIIGAAELARGVVHFGEWSDVMARAVGERVRPHLDEIFTAANKTLDQELRGTGPTRVRRGQSTPDFRARVKERAADGDTLADLRPYLRQLALEHIRSGIADREPLLTALHGDVEPAFPGITRNEVRDALSGYGDFRPLDKAADKTRLREIQGEAQKLAQLEALERGRAPLASGFERQTPSDEARRLTQQVNAAKKAAGITQTDRDGQLRSALASAKTRVRNQIKDLQTEIDTGERIVRGARSLIGDAELTALKEQLAELRAEEARVFGAKGLSNEQRLALATRAAEANVKRWETRVHQARTGVFDVRRQPRQSTSPLIESLRASARAAKAEYDELKAADPAQRQSANEAANRAYRTRLAQREAELRRRIASDDYGPRPIRPGLIPDRETMARKTEVEAVRQRYNELNHQYGQAQRSGVEKAADRWTRFVRFGVLSWPTVLGKLTSVALTRVVTTPLTDVVALGVSHALPGLARGAPRYGAQSIRTALHAEAAAQTAMWVDGLKQSGQLLKNRRSRLELLHGKERLPPEIADYMGRLHAALKEPIKEAEYARSLYRRTQAAMERGEDATSPFVQLRLSTEAYLDAERAVSMNHNVVTDAWNNAIRRLTQTDKATGKPNPLGVLLSAVARTEMPVVKAPVNVVMEASEIIAGLPIGAARAAWAYAHGIEDLEPIERDSIIRMIAKGSIGLAIMALYFYKHDRLNFGGFYQPGEKRKPSDIPAGGAQVAGHTLPPSLVHNPFFAAGQFAASIARVAPARITKHGRERQGYGNALMAASVGLLSETPILGSLVDELRDIKDPTRRNEFLSTRAASVAVPGVVQWVAKEHDDATPRKPIGLRQHLEYNLPGLRESVPTVKARQREAIIRARLAR